MVNHRELARLGAVGGEGRGTMDGMVDESSKTGEMMPAQAQEA
jgi:hypothetical protein